MFFRFALAVALALTLTACSPDYNWREIAVADGMVRATFPAKPDTIEKTLRFSEYDISFTLTAARVGDALFAVAYAPLPDALQHDVALRTEMGESVIRSFYQNLSLPVPDELPLFGEELALGGVADGQETSLRAKVWVSSRALIEVMVLGETQTYPQYEADQFLTSLVAETR